MERTFVSTRMGCKADCLNMCGVFAQVTPPFEDLGTSTVFVLELERKL